MELIPRGGRDPRRAPQAGDPQGDARHQVHAGPLRLRPSRTRACSRCSTRSSTTCPSPLDVPPVDGHRPGKTEEERRRAHADDSEPFAALAFKIMADPFVGKLTYFRVYSGKLEAGGRVLNVDDRQDRAHRPHPDDARQRPRGGRGGLRRRHRRRRRHQADRHRRHALPRPTRRSCSSRSTSRSRSSRSPIEPKTKSDQEKMSVALGRLAEEDPTFRSQTDEETGQTDDLRHGRAAPRGARRPHDARVQRRGQRRQAAGRLPRDDPRHRREGRGQVRPPDRRLGPVRRRRTSTSSRRPARASSSSTRSRAARSRPSSSPRSRRASRRRWRPASRPATRWSTSGSS